MSLLNLSSVSQGTVGLGFAIAHYVAEGKIVSIPLNDNQDYDLVVEENGKLKKVQVKTSRVKENGNFRVEIRKIRSNKTINKVIEFNNTTCDIVFVYCDDGTKYSIPSDKIHTKTTIVLNQKFNEFKL